MGLMDTLTKRPEKKGFTIGLVAIALIIILMLFTAFLQIGIPSERLATLQMIFVMGLAGTFMFSEKKRRGTGIVTVKEVSRQIQVIYSGIIGGVVLIAMNMIAMSGINYLMPASTMTDVDIIYFGILAGISEELFFRGVVQNFFRMFMPFMIMAIIPSALIFSLFHFFAYQSVNAFVVLFIMGIVLGLIHEMTNDIGAPMLAHIINNVAAMMTVISVFIFDNIMVFGFIVIVLVFTMICGASGRRRR